MARKRKAPEQTTTAAAAPRAGWPADLVRGGIYQVEHQRFGNFGAELLDASERLLALRFIAGDAQVDGCRCDRGDLLTVKRASCRLVLQ